MKKLSAVLTVACLLACTAAGAVTPTKLLGDPSSPAQAQRTIVITPATRYVNVTGGDVVSFVSNGQAFTWSFDGPPEVSSFELNRVAPPGALDHAVTAYVATNPEYAD
jgi:hypothetical protein